MSFYPSDILVLKACGLYVADGLDPPTMVYIVGARNVFAKTETKRGFGTSSVFIAWGVGL